MSSRIAGRSDPRLRLGILGIVAISLFAALFARLWYLQVLEAPELQAAAEANQQREIVEPAPRGRILDRNGVVLVDNRITLEVSLDRQGLNLLDAEETDDLLERVAEQLASAPPAPGTPPGTAFEPPTVDDIELRLASDRFSPYQAVPVAEDVPVDVAVHFTERAEEYADVVQVEQRAVRTYPMGRLAAHVLGYVGAINDDEFAARQDSDLLYQLGDEIGKSGVERAYEQYLRGQPGRRVIEVDRRGNTVSTLSYTEPVAGNDVYLSIDATIQAIAETALREELETARGRSVSAGNEPNVAEAGSTVLMDPNSGGVIAMASYPTYDPAEFTDGIDDAEWAALNADGNFDPLVNRTLEGQYAPGSTFKPFTAYGAMAAGVLDPNATVNDPGFYQVQNCSGAGCQPQNAGSTPYGNVDLRASLAVSSDVYYYALADRLWNQRATLGEEVIQNGARAFGFGSTTGIELPELDGRIPTPAVRAEQVEERPDVYSQWRTGDNINTSIGQGEVAATPMQIAVAYGALANGGRLLEPRLVDRIQRAGSDPADATAVVLDVAADVSAEVSLPPEVLAPLRDGLAASTGEGPLGRGTSAATFGNFPATFPVAGKTGTSQATNRADTALFAGYAPATAPQYVGVAVLEESGFGGVAAAPVVARMLQPIADPGLLPQLLPGGVLSEALAEATDPFSEGDVTD